MQDFEKNTEKTAVDTSNWKTYQNEKYGFEVRYPKNWILKEQLGDPAGDDISIHSPLHEDSFMRILPIGWAAGEGPNSRTVISKEIVSGKNAEITHYLLENNSEWARWINFIGVNQKNWDNKWAFINMYAHVDNLEKKCLAAITPDNPECGLGDPFGYYGTVDVQDWTMLKQILSTFKFIK